MDHARAVAAGDDRHTATSHASNKQTPGGQFGPERAACKHRAARPGAGTRSSARASGSPSAEPDRARCPRQRQRRQHRGEPAQREDVGATRRTLTTVHLRQLVALAGGVEDAEGQRAHQRALLLAPATAADRAHELVHLRRHTRTFRPAALHQFAHARLADAQLGGRLGAAETLQVAETRGLLLAGTHATAQTLEGMAQALTVVECARQIRLSRAPQLGQIALDARELRTAGRRTGLVDRPAKADLHEPAGGVLDLLTLQQRRVQPLPGLRVAPFQVAIVEDDPARAQPFAHDAEHPLALGLELLAQHAFGAVATQRQGAHGLKDYEPEECCELVESARESRPSTRRYLHAIASPPDSTPVPPPRAEILDVPLAVSDYEQVIDWMDAMVTAGERGYLTAAAVNLVMSARESPETMAAVRGATLAVPDGMPLVWALRALGHADATRVYGPDLMLGFCAHAAAVGTPMYLYGGRDETALQLLTERLRERFPGLCIAGGFSPPFRALTADEERQVVANIDGSGAQVVWVGTGQPKQELWMHHMRPLLQAPLLVGVGAAFDFHAGLVPQAPRWMQRNGLEWSYRLAREPRRLWRRYARYNPAFVAGFARQYLRERR